jgi:hypothetical protein
MQFDLRGGKATNYLLGRGRLMISGDVKRYNAGAAIDGSKQNWRDVGNITNFTVSQESESKEHRSSLQGIQVIDLEVPVSQKMVVTFAVDEINVINLARFFSGELLSPDLNFTLANASCVDSTTNTSNENWFVDTNTTDQVHDMWYDLDLNIPVLGGVFRAIDFQTQANQAITVRKQATSRTATDGTNMTAAGGEGVTYEIDRKLGRIRFFDVAGGITRGDTIQVRWAAPTGDASKNTSTAADAKLFMIKLLTTSSASVALMFISENPNNGDEGAGLEMFKVKLKPDGEFAGIGDDWAALSFSGALESVTSPPPGASAYGRWIGRTAYST